MALMVTAMAALIMALVAALGFGAAAPAWAMSVGEAIGLRRRRAVATTRLIRISTGKDASSKRFFLAARLCAAVAKERSMMTTGPEDMRKLFEAELYQAEVIGLLLSTINGKRCFNYYHKINEAADNVEVNVADNLWVLAHLFVEIERCAPPEERPWIFNDLTSLIDLTRDKMVLWGESKI
jgi:hypothetical protein